MQDLGKKRLAWELLPRLREREPSNYPSYKQATPPFFQLPLDPRCELEHVVVGVVVGLELPSETFEVPRDGLFFGFRDPALHKKSNSSV